MSLTYWSAPDLLAPRHKLSDFNIVEWSIEKIPLSHINDVVCNELSVEPELVKGKLRKRELVQARQVIFYLAYKYSGLSLKKIGEPYLRRDHSTVLHNIAILKNYLDTEPEFAELVKRIEQKII